MKYAFLLAAVALSGCAGLEIDGKGGGFVYYDPLPYLLVTCDKDGNQVANVVALPDPNGKHKVRPRPGWGSSTQSVSFANGMVTTFNQVNDPKSLETLTSLTGLFGLSAKGAEQCRTRLYPIEPGGGALALGREVSLAN